MSAARSSSIVILLSLLLLPAASDLRAQDKREEIWKLVENVTNVLQGKPANDPASFIAPRANLVRSGEMIPLIPAVSAPAGRGALADTTYHGVVLQVQTNRIEDAGYLLVKTRAADTTKIIVHTLFFTQDSTGRFLVRLWHADPPPSIQ